MGTITLNEKQRRRGEIITRLIANKISSSEASELLAVTDRQVRRIRRRYEAQGLETLVHGNQGRPSPRRTKPALIEQLRELAGLTGRYHDFNVSHLAELLARDEGIKIPRSTLSRLLITHHIRPPRRSKLAVKRMQRERKSAEGMMLQTDASPHDWLEGRAPAMDLLGAIDDATGKVVYARFRPSEDQLGYLLMLRSVALTYGLPHILYHDRHTILRSPEEATIEDELAGRKPQSQIQRIIEQFGITSIPTLSPQPKGRIASLATFQDRLRKEMRLAGIALLAQATYSSKLYPSLQPSASLERRAIRKVPGPAAPGVGSGCAIEMSRLALHASSASICLHRVLGEVEAGLVSLKKTIFTDVSSLHKISKCRGYR